MIDGALTFLQSSTSNFLNTNLPDSTYTVELSSMLSQDGKLEFAGDAVALTLINVEEEFAVKDQNRRFVKPSGDIHNVNPALHLNLYVLFSVHYKVYSEGLKCLSGIIRYFQDNIHFTQANSPSLEEEIEWMTLELYTLNFEQINQLWGALGTKYRPSVIYKVRMLSVQNTDSAAAVPQVGTLTPSLNQMDD